MINANCSSIFILIKLMLEQVDTVDELVAKLAEAGITGVKA